MIVDKRDGPKGFCSVALSRGAMGWSAVCDCSILIILTFLCRFSEASPNTKLKLYPLL